jgi:polyphosphate kinase 2 (PPK2 family)
VRLARISVSIVALAALSILSLAQQKDAATSKDKQKQDTSKSKQKEESQSPFKNAISYSSSKTTKESTTVAFKGVDPSGKVEQEVLAKTPTDADREKVKLMAQNQPTAAELQAFLLQGGLKQK